MTMTGASARQNAKERGIHMKNRLIRILALAMLLALAVGIVPATAAAKKLSIDSMTLYADTGSHFLELKNRTWEEEIISVTSRNTKVIDLEGEDSLWWVIPRKVGSSLITVKYRLGGKTYTIKKTLKVLKYPAAIKKLTINGRKIELKDINRIQYRIDGDIDKKVSATINLVPAKGWKISGIKGYKTSLDGSIRKSVKVTNNRKLTFGKNFYGHVFYTLKNKKTGKTFQYTIEFDHVGE